MLLQLVLLQLAFSSNIEPQKIVEQGVVNIKKQDAFDKKWKSLSLMRKELISSRPNSVETIMYKNGILEMMSLLDKKALQKKDCSAIKSKIDLDYKVNSNSKENQTKYYLDIMKTLRSFCI